MDRPIPHSPSGSQTGARFGTSTPDHIPERVVFATSKDGTREIVRRNRRGRWFEEAPGYQRRFESLHEAVQTALIFEDLGGVIYSGQPGGKQFDAKVAGGRRRGRR